MVSICRMTSIFIAQILPISFPFSFQFFTRLGSVFAEDVGDFRISPI